MAVRDLGFWQDKDRGAIVTGRSGMLILTIVALLCTGSRPFAQQSAGAVQHPSLTGTWLPSEPARSDELFAVGLTTIPGNGQLTIDQRSDRLTVTITLPDDKLDPLLSVNGRFYTTIIYRLSGRPERSGGAGAGGPQPPSVPTWFGDRLVIPDARPSPRRTTTTYSLVGDRLKLETSVEISAGRANMVTQWLTRAK